MEDTLRVSGHDHIDARLLAHRHITRRSDAPSGRCNHPAATKERLNLGLEVVFRHVPRAVDAPITEALNARKPVNGVGQGAP